MHRFGLTALAFLCCAPMVHAQSDTLPPLQAVEYFTKSASGCGLIWFLPPDAAPDFVAAQQRRIAVSSWQGPCQYGLAFGHWTAGTTEVDYAFGRQLSRRVVVRYGGWHGRSILYRGGDTSVSMPAWDDPYAAKWGEGRVGVESQLEGTTHIVRAFEASCASFPQSFPDCPKDFKQAYDIAGVRIGTRTDPRTAATVWGKTVDDRYFWCPNPRTTDGCAALWHEKAAPIVADIARFIAKTAAQDSQRVGALARLNARWMAAHPGPRVFPQVVTAAPQRGAVARPSTPAAPPVSAPVAPSASRPVVAQPVRGPVTYHPMFYEPGARVVILAADAPSRTSCMHVQWITSWREKVAGLDHGTFMNPYRQTPNQRALIATNDCGENVWVTSLVCSEDRMTEPSTARFHQMTPGMSRWSRGAMRGIWLHHGGFLNGEANVAPGWSVYLAQTKSHVRRPRDNPDFDFESQEQLVDVLFGAWPLDAVWNAAERRLTPLGMVIDRKRTATIAAFNVRAISSPPTVQHGARGFKWPSLAAQSGVSSCSSARMSDAWSSTR